MTNSIIVTDVETNGFRGSSVVEIAILKYDIEDLKELGTKCSEQEIFHRYYWPVEKPNPHAIKVHGLDGKKIYDIRKKSGKYYSKYFKDDKDIDKIMENVIGIVGHNISFDISFFPKKYQSIPTYCTMLNNRNIFGKNPRLSHIVDHYNICFEESDLHSALYDTTLTSMVFKYMVENQINHSRDWLDEIVREYNKNINLFDMEF